MDGSPRTRDLAWWRLAQATGAVTRTVCLTIGGMITLTIALTGTLLTALAEGLHNGLTYGSATEPHLGSPPDS